MVKQSLKSTWKIIGASSAGTMIEWYDFYIFGSLATLLSEQFFPKENPTAAFLATLAAFGVGFVIRPFGAVIFGRLGDIIGRKYTFLLTLLLMGGSTFAIGLVPSYESIGVAAPVVVFLLRALQGLALGGEYGGAAIYVAEHAPHNRKGFFTSFIQTTATLGLLVSLGVILGCKAFMSPVEFSTWGWRIPFLVSAILVAISYYIRKKMEESPEFARLKDSGKTSKNPLMESFGKWKNLKWVLIALFGATAGQGVVWYTGQFYAMNFCIKTLGIDSGQVQKLLILVLLAGTPLFILFASLSDRVGRKWIMLGGMLLAAVCYLPIYKAMAKQADWKSWKEINNQNDFEMGRAIATETGDILYIWTHNYENGAVKTEQSKTLSDNSLKSSMNIKLPAYNIFIIGLLIFAQLVFVTMTYGPIAAFLVELFPTRIRYTSLSLPYHIGNGVFGGLTPLIAESVVVKSGNIFAGLYYPIGIAAITFVIGLFFLKNKPAEQKD